MSYRYSVDWWGDRGRYTPQLLPVATRGHCSTYIHLSNWWYYMVTWQCLLFISVTSSSSSSVCACCCCCCCFVVTSSAFIYTMTAVMAIEWTYMASWRTPRWGACPWWGSLWGFYLPGGRRRAVLWLVRRRSWERGGAGGACRSGWVGWGTGSSRTPPGRTDSSPAGSPRDSRPIIRTRLKYTQNKYQR